MTVTCPSCNTKFSVNVTLLKTTQQKMRCSKCRNVFVFTLPDAGTANPVVDQEVPQPTFAEIAAQMGIEEAKDSPEPPVQQQGTGKPVMGLKATVIALIVLAICAGGYFYWTNYWRAGDRWLRISKLSGQEVVVQDGRVFLVTGVIGNGSTKGRKSIVLRVKLFDRDGKAFIEKDALAGMLLSKQQAPTMLKADIQKRVAAFKLSPAETFRVEAGKEIPFSVSFLDEDFPKAKEFSVEIIQSNYL
jgi:predicted Zn finger-like uncharacterized protein